MSEAYSVYNKNGTLVDETARCRVVKIKTGVYTWQIEGGSAASSDAQASLGDDPYEVIKADISGPEKTGVPIEWPVDSAGDFYIVAVCGEQIIDGLPSSKFSYEQSEKTLWLTCPFENADFWTAYIFRNEAPVNNFSISEGRAKISAILAQFEKDNRVLRQLAARDFRNLRTPDTIKTLPPINLRAGKILAFDGDGNPDLSLSKEDIAAFLNEAKSCAQEAEASAELAIDALNKIDELVRAFNKSASANSSNI